MELSELQRVNEFERVLPRRDESHAAIRFFATQQQLSKFHPQVLRQVEVLSTLDGVKDAIVVFPHAVPSHAVPLGIVFASGVHDGIMMPGGINWDINLGVRTLTTNLIFPDVDKKMGLILKDIQRVVPVGSKATGRISLSKRDLLEIFSQGARWVQENKSPEFQDELEYIEDYGDLPVSNLTSVPEFLLEEERKQFGTIRHFLEFQIVSEVFDVEKARVYGLFKNQLLITYRAGSASLGRAVWWYYYRLFKEKMEHYGITPPHSSMVYLPAHVTEAQLFYQAVQCVSNYALANRQFIAAQVYHVLNVLLKDVEANTMYDSATNTIRKEIHALGSLPEEVYVYRKGSVRTQIRDEGDLSRSYHVVGNPALLWGGVGQPSYIVSGKDPLLEKSFGSLEVVQPTVPPSVVGDQEWLKNLKDQGIFLRSQNEILDWRFHPKNTESPRAAVDFWLRSSWVSRIAAVKPVGILLA
ncbi:RtcB family protein [Thermospira aquatica]|uniref:tRNA-splicing ligase RtcB n=1 Tax=Thermospira aquatica TaxID=2828656 RepID=A0AAX3BE28_9SPIR|nr:RtcB family protein [Thermospira aquatica]URA10358.1 RtcB family protein [Thermospira aquatica]